MLARRAGFVHSDMQDLTLLLMLSPVLLDPRFVSQAAIARSTTCSSLIDK
jgi:hypothetical protein